MSTVELYESYKVALQFSLLEILERPALDALFKPDQIFSSEDGAFICRLTEDTRFDRKSAKVERSGLAQCLSAFGNGSAVEGGVVAVGIEKNGTVTGCAHLSENRLQETETAGQDMCPDGRYETRRIPVVNASGKPDFLVLIRIYYVESRLVKLTNGEAYCRQSDRSRKLSDAEKEEIRISEGERSFELEACSLSYPNDFCMSEIKNFVNRIRIERGASSAVETILQSMRLGKSLGNRFAPNNVCALLFANDPRDVFPGSYVHFLRYNGTQAGSGSAYNVIKDRVIDGTVLDIIKETASVLDANLREFTAYRNGKFHSVPEYPRDAWYEMIVNACVHRTYHARDNANFCKDV